MKKTIILLGAISVVATTGSSVVSCVGGGNGKGETVKPITKEKKYINKQTVEQKLKINLEDKVFANTSEAVNYINQNKDFKIEGIENISASKYSSKPYSYINIYISLSDNYYWDQNNINNTLLMKVNINLQSTISNLTSEISKVSFDETNQAKEYIEKQFNTIFGVAEVKCEEKKKESIQEVEYNVHLKYQEDITGPEMVNVKISLKEDISDKVSNANDETIYEDNNVLKKFDSRNVAKNAIIKSLKAVSGVDSVTFKWVDEEYSFDYEVSIKYKEKFKGTNIIKGSILLKTNLNIKLNKIREDLASKEYKTNDAAKVDIETSFKSIKGVESATLTWENAAMMSYNVSLKFSKDYYGQEHISGNVKWYQFAEFDSVEDQHINLKKTNTVELVLSGKNLDNKEFEIENNQYVNASFDKNKVTLTSKTSEGVTSKIKIFDKNYSDSYVEFNILITAKSKFVEEGTWPNGTLKFKLNETKTFIFNIQGYEEGIDVVEARDDDDYTHSEVKLIDPTTGKFELQITGLKTQAWPGWGTQNMAVWLNGDQVRVINTQIK